LLRKGVQRQTGRDKGERYKSAQEGPFLPVSLCPATVAIKIPLAAGVARRAALADFAAIAQSLVHSDVAPFGKPQEVIYRRSNRPCCLRTGFFFAEQGLHARAISLDGEKRCLAKLLKTLPVEVGRRPDPSGAVLDQTTGGDERGDFSANRLARQAGPLREKNA
jgi:hypothetical protein